MTAYRRLLMFIGFILLASTLFADEAIVRRNVHLRATPSHPFPATGRPVASRGSSKGSGSGDSDIRGLAEARAGGRQFQIERRDVRPHRKR